MARQKGVFKFVGTIDGLTYYNSKFGPLVRRKGGPSREQILYEPSFKRVRENGMEFRSLGMATKLLRSVLRPMMLEASDFQVTSRITKLMSGLKNLDAISVRGERNVGVGITMAGAKDLIKGFDFNNMAKLDRVLKKQATVNINTGVIGIAGLKPKQDIACPKGATHARILGGWVRINFTPAPGELDGKGELIQTNQVVLPLNGVLNNVVLTPVALPGGVGKDIFVLKIVFFQEVNGVQYELKNGEHNSMGIVEVV